MSSATSLFDKESLKNLDASHTYSDQDGPYDCRNAMDLNSSVRKIFLLFFDEDWT
jgi:hypothetical protein